MAIIFWYAHWFLFLSKTMKMHIRPRIHLIQSVSIYSSATSQTQSHCCMFNDFSCQYSKSYVRPWKCSKKVLIWSDLTRKFHQRFKKRIISTCTFKPAATQLENCWHTSICEEFRLAILLEYIQASLKSTYSAIYPVYYSHLRYALMFAV